MKKLIPFLVFGSIIAFIIYVNVPKDQTKRTENIEPEHTEPPPGWKIVCDEKAGLFAPCYKGAVYDGRNHTNRQGAINHAWINQKIFERWAKEKTYDWKECE